MQHQISQRKIQRLGGSSLIITIPKSWARRMGLKPGDSVLIVDDGDHLRIMPPIRGITSGSNSNVRIKYGAVMKTVSMAKIAQCALLYGYKRLIVEGIRGHEDDVLREVDLLGRELGDAIESIDIDDNEVVISFKEGMGHDRNRLIKEINTSLQNILDLADFKLRLRENVESRATGLDTVKTYANLMRIVIQEAPLFSSTRAASDIIAASMVNLIIQLSMALVELAPPDADLEISGIIGKLKLAASEALGGLASGSIKRASNSAEVAEDIMRTISDKRNGSLHYGILYGLALAVRQLALTTICKLSMPG